MKIALRQVTIDEKQILHNLLEKYSYEFSQYDQRDVNDLGLFGYMYLDHYWTDPKRWAYFIEVDQKLAGFAMIIDLPEVKDRETDYQMAEFFIMHKYRRKGIGNWAFLEVIKRHPGRWQLKRHPKNLDSVLFWDRVIAQATDGNHELVIGYPNTEYDDGSLGDVYFFEVKP